MEETLAVPVPTLLRVCIICSNTADPEGAQQNDEDKPDQESVETNSILSYADKLVTGNSIYESCKSQEINRFVKEVLLQVNENVEGSKVKADLSHLEKLKSLPICGNCVAVIKAAVDKKIEADKAKRRVKELEAQVLEEMKKLEVQLMEYYVEMKRIGEIVERADLSKLEGALKVGGEESRCEEETGAAAVQLEASESEDAQKNVAEAEIESQVTDGTNDNQEAPGLSAVECPTNFQEKKPDQGVEQECDYFSIVNNLHKSILFAILEINEKMNSDGKDDKRRKSRRLKKKAKRKYFDSSAIEDSIAPLFHCAVKMESFGGEGIGGKRRDNLASDLSIPEFNMETLIKIEPMDEDVPTSKNTEDVGDAIINDQAAVAPPPPIFEDDDGFEPEVISEVIVTGGEEHRHRPRRRRKTFSKSGDNGEVSENEDGIGEDDELLEDSSDDDFFLDEGEDDLGSESESSSEEEEASSDDPEWDDGEGYGRKERKKHKKEMGDKMKREGRKADPNSKTSRKTAYSKILDSINFSAMSKLKRKLIQRILHKKYRRPTRKPKTPGKEDVADPRLEHFIEYDNLLDTLSLDGIPINVIEEKTDEGDELLILECSACSWQARPAAYSRHPVDSFIYNHIAGQHLNLFQCVQCGSNLGGFKQYSDHVLGHRMGFACDVCGRPLGGAQALARHKWSHLNDQEAAELIAKGLKDPREKKESTKIYPCPTCGKIFPQRCQLKKHEKVHSSVRERITCEICGKQFLPSGFISHKRYYCFPEGVDHPRISCPLCPKVFKNKQFMQVHMDRAHNTERNHKCAQCGKGFKTKKDLMTHEETHTTERAFSCKKGCGRSYKTRKNCNAHEKRCDGRGGVLIQRFLDAGEDRPFSCRKGCGRAYKTRRTLRGHEKTCNGNPFVGEFPVVGGTGGGGGGMGGEGQQQITTMTVLGAALQSSMEAVMGGVIQTTTTIAESVPEAVVTETVITVTKSEFN